MLELYPSASMVIKLLSQFKVDTSLTMNQQLYVLYKLAYLGHTASSICENLNKSWYLNAIKTHTQIYQFPTIELNDISQLPNLDNNTIDELQSIFNKLDNT